MTDSATCERGKGVSESSILWGTNRDCVFSRHCKNKPGLLAWTKRSLLRSEGLRWVGGSCSPGWDKPCCGCCCGEGEGGDNEGGEVHAFGAVELGLDATDAEPGYRDTDGREADGGLEH